MKNDKIERSVKRAFVNAAPYQLDKVTEKCKEQKGKVIPLENKQAKKIIIVPGEQREKPPAVPYRGLLAALFYRKFRDGKNTLCYNIVI